MILLLINLFFEAELLVLQTILVLIHFFDLLPELVLLRLKVLLLLVQFFHRPLFLDCYLGVLVHELLLLDLDVQTEVVHLLFVIHLVGQLLLIRLFGLVVVEGDLVLDLLQLLLELRDLVVLGVDEHFVSFLQHFDLHNRLHLCLVLLLAIRSFHIIAASSENLCARKSLYGLLLHLLSKFCDILCLWL